MNSTNHALHVHFLLRNQQAFTKLLETCKAPSSSSQTAMSSSAGKSWSRVPQLSSRTQMLDVNARDDLGRTVLHLVASSTDPASLEYLKLLLSAPTININIPDRESNWTPLHRALYAGNIPAAIQLLRRSDIDVQAKDYEGCTALEVYNSTVHGTSPSHGHGGIQPRSDDTMGTTVEFYTWGANRNATLGHSDGDDRTYPDQVELRSSKAYSSDAIRVRYSPMSICDVAMSRFHTVVITDTSRNNVWMCGIGGGGRLGPSVHTQHGFQQVSPIHSQVIRVSSGQDHTIALCENGDVLTWGLNRFYQLGYVVETVKASDEPIQTTPKKVHGPIKKEMVIGIAGSKKASACWTSQHLFTWGTNTGNLGYDCGPQSFQVLPRRVSFLAEPVIDVALSEGAMVCLLQSKEIVCFSGDTHFKINFNSSRPMDGPFQSLSKVEIVKVVTNEDLFACLSRNGDVYTFPAPSSPSSSRAATPVKPQLVWALRRKLSAVKDVALGCDGSLILCTRSGQVFVRTRTPKALGGKSFKFQQVPFLHRAFRVFANSSGSYGVLCETSPPQPLDIPDGPLSDDIRQLLPWFHDIPIEDTDEIPEQEHDPEPDDARVDIQVRLAKQIIKYLQSRWRNRNEEADFEEDLGLDVVLQADVSIGAHCFMLDARCPALTELQLRKPRKDKDHALERTEQGKYIFKGYNIFSVVCLLTYLYTDDVVSIWDRRIASRLASVEVARIDPSRVKQELISLASLLHLPALAASLHTTGIATPQTTLAMDLRSVFGSGSTLNDVALELSDYTFKAASSILRARSKYFADFFSEACWNKARRNPDGSIAMQFPHFRWKPARVVIAYIYYGDVHLFHEVLGSHECPEEAIDFAFEAIAIASELLLDRFIRICSNAVIDLVAPPNISAVLTDASFLQLLPLNHSLHRYIATNMGIVLDSCLLDDLPSRLLREVMEGIQTLQREKHPFTRSSDFYKSLLKKHAEWISLQDFPTPIVAAHRTTNRDSPKLSPMQTGVSIPHKNSIPEHPAGTAGSGSPDAVFAMDEELAEIPALSLPPNVTQHPKGASPWRLAGTGSSDRLDFKSIMAEASAASDKAATPSRKAGSPRQGGMINPSKPRAGEPPMTRRVSLENSEAAQLLSSKPSPNPTLQPSGFPETSKPSAPQADRTRPGLIPTARHKDPAPGMGPTFTPTKATASRQTTPKATRSPWSQSTASSSSAYPAITPGESRSFANIQQQQQRQQETPSPRSKPSLREIQEQEAAQREEQEFLRWWAEEEARIRKDELAAANQLRTQQDRGRRSNPRAGRGSRGRGAGNRPALMKSIEAG